MDKNSDGKITVQEFQDVFIKADSMLREKIENTRECYRTFGD